MKLKQSTVAAVAALLLTLTTGTAFADICAYEVNGNTLELGATTNINAVSTDNYRVKGILVNNSGVVTNKAGNSLSVSVKNTSAATDSRADGIVLWNDNHGTPTHVDLYGVEKIITAGREARCLDVWDESNATVRGTGNAVISASADADSGESLGIQVIAADDSVIKIDGFSKIEAISKNGYARTMNLWSGHVTVNGVKEITAYGGKQDVDPEYVGQYGLAYAVSACTGPLETGAPYWKNLYVYINGDNTAIKATSEKSNAVGIGSSITNSDDECIIRADGIASVTSTANGDAGSYSYATGLYVIGGELYLNQKNGSPYADITVSAENDADVTGVCGTKSGVVRSKINNLTASAARSYAFGVENIGSNVNIDLKGEIKVNAQDWSYGVFVEENGTTEIIGNGSINVCSSSNSAYGVRAEDCSNVTATIKSMTVKSAADKDGVGVYVDSGAKVTLTGGDGTFTIDAKQIAVVSGDNSKLTLNGCIINAASGPVFTIEAGGKLVLSGDAKIKAADGRYFNDGAKAEDITIADGVLFWFGTDAAAETKAKEFARKYIGGGERTLVKDKDGYWRVGMPKPAPEPVKPVLPEEEKEKLPENVVPAEKIVTVSQDVAVEALSEDFDKECIAADETGKAVIAPEAAAKMLKNAGISSDASAILPMQIVYTSPDTRLENRIIMLSFKVSGIDLIGDVTKKPNQLCVYNALHSKDSGRINTASIFEIAAAEAAPAGDTEVGQFGYISDLSNAADKSFTLQDENGYIVSGDIDLSKNYLLSVFILDNGTFDLDHDTNGAVASAVFVDTSKISGENKPSSGSSVGCSAGFAALAVLTLAFVPTRKKK
ncbi:MAG: hypothetical protein Q4E17_06390 [Synergistes sp.]|nr:hypothetical protein [Synergistes sp.]